MTPEQMRIKAHVEAMIEMSDMLADVAGQYVSCGCAAHRSALLAALGGYNRIRAHLKNCIKDRDGRTLN